MSFGLIIVSLIGILVVAILVEAWLKRGKAPRPLAERMRSGMEYEGSSEEEPLLGMEATDLKIVEDARKLNALAALTSDKVRAKYRSNNRRT